jgi:hypothetical protein
MLQGNNPGRVCRVQKKTTRRHDSVDGMKNPVCRKNRGSRIELFPKTSWIHVPGAPSHFLTRRESHPAKYQGDKKKISGSGQAVFETMVTKPGGWGRDVPSQSPLGIVELS